MTAEDAINVFKEEFCGLEAYCEIQRDGLCITDGCEVWWAIKALEQCKADVAEVVRCKDCAKCQVDTIFNQFWCGGERVLPNGFCNYGERKNVRRI